MINTVNVTIMAETSKLCLGHFNLCQFLQYPMIYHI